MKRAVLILGEVIQYQVGQDNFELIESTRKKMTRLRGLSPENIYFELQQLFEKFQKVSPKKRILIAHAFSLMLELINSCENAYRSFRLMQYPKKHYSKFPQAIIYVVTAHPTEARSPANIFIFHEIQKTLTRILIQDHQENWDELKSSLSLAWSISVAKTRRPAVRDEAEHIYSIILREETLNAILDSRLEFGPIYIRSWVGGDKDGHPGVNENTLHMSLQISRERLLQYFELQLRKLDEPLKWVRNLSPNLVNLYHEFSKVIMNLHLVYNEDGVKITKLHSIFKNLAALYEKEFGVLHPQLHKLRILLQMFPALVVPMEIREHSSLVQSGAKGEVNAICKMLRKIGSIAKGGNPSFYTRGLIISMAHSYEDIKAGAILIQKYLGGLKIPVIPLFEREQALHDSPMIMKQMLEDRVFKKAIQNQWGGYVEVMLGYSDSAKDLGVLASHLAIMKATHKLDCLYKNYSLAPIFFHGSGGSTDRGGGSIEEQTEWWPKSALEFYKATIQGEMVERTFASSEITRRRFEQIVSQMNQPHPKSIDSKPGELLKLVQDFSHQVSGEYQKKISSPDFLKVVYEATAYRYLSILRIGSRPARREKSLSIGDLRTIPWVLCWTQTRILFPTWWGIGTVWKKLKNTDDCEKKMIMLRQAFNEVPVFRSYIKLLSSTLARIELPIWRFYLENSELSQKFRTAVFNDFKREYQLSTEFVRRISGRNNLLWFRPWFGESIRLRSSMIHPLNLLQIIAMKKLDRSLLRETFTGISSGMMTTG